MIFKSLSIKKTWRRDGDQTREGGAGEPAVKINTKPWRRSTGQCEPQAIWSLRTPWSGALAASALPPARKRCACVYWVVCVCTHKDLSESTGGIRKCPAWFSFESVCLRLALKGFYIPLAQKSDGALLAYASNQKCMRCSCRDNTFSPKALAEQIRCQWGARAGSTFSN